MILLDVQAFGASSSSTLSPFQSRQRKVSAYVTSLTPPPPITVNEARSRKASAMPGLMPTKSALKSKRFELILSVLTNMGSYSIFKETLFKSYINLIKSYDIMTRGLIEILHDRFYHITYLTFFYGVIYFKW